MQYNKVFIVKKAHNLGFFHSMPKIRAIIVEEYNSDGHFSPPNPYGHEVSVGRETEGGDDETMERDLQADIGAQPIKAIDEADIDSQVGEILIKRIVEKLGDYGTPKFVGEGEDGLAYELRNKIYKLTKSPSEVNDSIKVKGKHNAHLADVYGVYKLTNTNIGYGIYVIVLEKLRVDRNTFARLEDSLINVFSDAFGRTKYRYQNFSEILRTYKENRQQYLQKYEQPLKQIFTEYPQEKFYFESLLKIIDELNANGVKSMDMIYTNLGYKQNGNIAFFDMGRGGENETPSVDSLKLENVDGYHMADAHNDLVGMDINAPIPNNNEYIPENIDGIVETIFERVLTFMPKSKTVTVKKKCRLGGNGDGTSTACNQGDINALEINEIKDELFEDVKNKLSEIIDSELLREDKDVKIEYGTAMLKLDVEGWDKMTSIIDVDDVYDKPTFGLEKNPHVTILYGFHKNVKPNEVKDIIADIHDIKKPIEIELTKISIFEVKDQEYDVVKYDVNSPILHKLNTALKKLPHTSTFPNYHPHVTISYVKKGRGKKYEKKLEKSITLQSKSIVFSTKNEKKTKLNENIVSVNTLPFKSEIEQSGGKIYSVGGAVRDGMLNRPSKDLDLLITGLPLDKLEAILAKYGRVDNVGKSFGIIKFNTPQTGELDIAIPRTERATGQGGYQGFEVTSDHNLPIEKDLERRDFTINAIAKDSNGNLIDPYNGQEDLKNKLIRMVNPQAFKEDPLRMIRAVQFAARFGFTIEPETMEAIRANANRIKEISPERILIEFDKIVKKGNPVVGAQLLVDSGLYGWIFDNNGKEDVSINYGELQKAKTMGEFIFIMANGNIPHDSPSAFYKDHLKGDLDTYNEIRAYELAYKHAKPRDVQTKLNIFGMNKLSPKSLESGILPHDVKENITEMKNSSMPFSMKEMQINGNDLLALGYTGQQIGELLKNLLIDIYSGKLNNNRDLLLRHLTPKNLEV